MTTSLKAQVELETQIKEAVKKYREAGGDPEFYIISKSDHDRNWKQALTALLDSLEAGMPSYVKNWDSEDGFCQTCEAFLEDDNYRCYCDIRNETVELVHSIIKEARGRIRGNSDDA